MNPIRFTVGMIQMVVRALIERAVRKAAARPFIDMVDPVRETVMVLHPAALSLVVTDVIDRGTIARTYRLEAARTMPYGLVPFQAGQYLSIRGGPDGAHTSRPYSLSSAPYQTGENGEGFYEITVRKEAGGFFSPFIWETWKQGTPVSATGPHGEFFYEELRDSGDIIAVAGGSGITPFVSMAREIVNGSMDARLTVLYGVRKMKDALFVDELADLAQQTPDRIRACWVVSEPDGTEKCATGFIDAALIKKEVGSVSGKTFFVCGPPALYDFFRAETAKLKITPRHVRWEVSGGIKDISAHVKFPKKAAKKTFTVTVQAGLSERSIPARADETILVAMERAGIAADSCCRSGSCGICRCELVSGEVFIDPGTDARRRADREYGFIHSCSTYPVGDGVVRITTARE